MNENSASQALYYRHSGKAPALGLGLGLGGGLVAGAVLAVVYAYLLVYIPIAGYVTFLLSGGFGALVGLAAGFGLRAGKVRNAAVALAVGLVVALIAEYVSWAVWVHAVLAREDVDAPMAALLLRPDVLFGLVKEINTVGAWTIKGVTPTGGFLWTLWAIEALIITAAAAVLAFGAVDEPFCEACGVFSKLTRAVLVTDAADRNEVRARLEQKALADLERLGAARPEAMSYLRFDVHSCPGCNAMHTLDANEVTRTVEKGKVEEKDDAIVTGLLLRTDELELVRGIAARLEHPAVAAA